MSGISFRKSDCKCDRCIFLMHRAEMTNKDGRKTTRLYCMIPKCIKGYESTQSAFFNAVKQGGNK